MTKVVELTKAETSEPEEKPMSEQEECQTTASHSEGIETYIVDGTGGDTWLLRVKPEWKLTFGPVTPQGARVGYALRIWEGKKLMACFTAVASFRKSDVTISKMADGAVEFAGQMPRDGKRW
jgi:hypothetical protein